VCPYHRWSYDLEGRLKTAPLMDAVEDFDRESCRLPELSLEIWQGFVMINVNPDAAPLGPQLKALSELIEPLGVGDFEEVGVVEFDSPYNWKVLVENFMESYHHLGPHADSLQHTNPAKDTYWLDLEGAFSALDNPSVGTAPDLWVFQVFPIMLLAVTRGEAQSLVWFEMQIDRVDHFHLRIHLLLPQEMAKIPDVATFFRDTITKVHLEDIFICEGITQGLRSRLRQAGTLSHQKRDEALPSLPGGRTPRGPVGTLPSTRRIELPGTSVRLEILVRIDQILCAGGLLSIDPDCIEL
jgi:phenylpropionate dioxygenase-like ring-hydroxylating dioxygenase large terminal subunit